MTISSYYYNESRRELLEYEMYFNINRRAEDLEDIVRIRNELERRGRRHYRNWLLGHLKVHLERKVDAKFEREYRAITQVEQSRASVRRFVMVRVERRWEATELSSGTMRFTKRPTKHRKKLVKKRPKKHDKKRGRKNGKK
jgi:hypothetical protein